MSSKPQAEPLRVLCFGDSLTAGYSRFGMIMTPYSQILKRTLETKILTGDRWRIIDVETDGLSGDLVTRGTFVRRMERKCSCFLGSLLVC
jgi:lysophospholipase L1-like esterase